MYDAHCIYCERVTGKSPDVDRRTVCSACQYIAGRSEQIEVAAGVSGGRPWARPLSAFWVGMLRQIPMPDADAAIAQQRWDDEQRRIKEFNDRSDARLRARPAGALVPGDVRCEPGPGSAVGAESAVLEVAHV